MEGGRCASDSMRPPFGILNGVDDHIWNWKATCCWLRAPATADRLGERAENKRQRTIAMRLKVDDKAPLFAVVSCLFDQPERLDSVLSRLPSLLERAVSWRSLGLARIRYCRSFRPLRPEHPGKVGVQITLP